MSYIFGGSTGETPASIRRRRELAAQIAASTRTPRNVGEGLGAVGNAIMYRALTGGANRAEATGREGANTAFNAVINAMMGGQAAAAPTQAVDRAPLPDMAADAPTQRVAQAFNAPRADIASGITSTANALGVDPVDLGTIISYETAGTFDPTKRGPTTKWGQHRGLIQFGEPQAQEFGVDWARPVESQLGPDGAVARYFRANGAQPGMGLMDLYSIVNAGGPGRENWSDENAGGAPGTVADKVNNQMGGHRAKAQAMLGDAPPAASRPARQTMGGLTPELMRAMSNPFLTDGQRQVMSVLMQNMMQQNDPMRALQMERLRLQNDQLRNPQSSIPDSVVALQERARLAGLEPGTEDYSEFMVSGGRGPLVQVSTGNKETDKAFATRLDEWQFGGAADSAKQMAQLQSVIEMLENPDMNLTGPGIGMVPDRLKAATNPQSLAAKDRVEEVVQRNLRIILGAQFTEKEGERLIARAYNQSLPEEENAKRLTALLLQMQEAATAMNDAQQHYAQNGTLAGWQGRLPSMADFAVFGDDEPANSAAGGAPEGVDPALWEVMTPEERALWQN